MNYRHAFHAGNFADVFKHATLARIVSYLAEKPQAFRVIDVHAGAGLYDLSGAEASRTGEWRAGIGRLQAASLPAGVQALLAPYLAAIARHNPAVGVNRYPGSPLVALAAMRRQDRLIACELEPSAARALKLQLARDRRAKAIVIDSWTALSAYVPPKERRRLVVIDPPFEAEDEFSKLASGLEAAHRKWPTGIYLAWFPVKDAAAGALGRRLGRSGIARILRTELHVPAPGPGRLAGAGMIVINPPWRLAEELRVLLPALSEVLGQGRGQFSLDWLAGEA